MSRRLPDLSIVPEGQQARATGTDGREVMGGSDLASCLTRHAGKQQTTVDDNGQFYGPGSGGGTAVECGLQGENVDSGPEMKKAALGFEPRNTSFANWRLRPLGYAA